MTNPTIIHHSEARPNSFKFYNVRWTEEHEGLSYWATSQFNDFTHPDNISRYLAAVERFNELSKIAPKVELHEITHGTLLDTLILTVDNTAPAPEAPKGMVTLTFSDDNVEIFTADTQEKAWKKARKYLRGLGLSIKDAENRTDTAAHF